MNNARQLHTAFILQNGEVLITGGSSDSTTLNSADLYDPSLAFAFVLSRSRI